VTESVEWPDARLLVVDDEQPIRELVRTSLLRAGYQEVATAASAAEGVAAALELVPDLVLLDIHMPAGSGLTVLGQLRDDPDLSEVPVLIMTGAGTPENITAALELGAVDIVHKPVSRAELLLRVRNLLRHRRMSESLRRHNRLLDDLVAERSEELEVLVAVLDRMPVPAFVFEEDGSLRYRNARARRLADPRAGDVLPAVSRALSDGATVVEAEDESGVRRYECVVHHDAEGRATVLLQDIEIHLELEARLRELVVIEQSARERVQGLDRLREELATAVSHRVRTPLTVVKGAAEVLHRRGAELPPDVVTGMHRSVHENAEVLERLLLDLLDLAAMSRGESSARRVGVDLGEVVAASLARRPHLVAETDVAGAWVLGDPELVRRILGYVLDNVTAHVGHDAAVHIGARTTDEGMLEVRVADRGPGIPPEDRERLFRRFERGSEVARHDPTVGIGLSLVRELCQLHGGDARLEETPGGGTTVVLLLQRAEGPDG
jgi:signal transduction histidine kinase